MSHTNPAPRRNWPWVVAVVVIVAVVIVGASVVSRVVAGTPAAQVTATSRPVEHSATPTASAPSGSTSTPRARTSLSKSDIAAIQSAIEDGDPTQLYTYLTSPVHVEFAASDFNSNRSRDNAVTDLDYVTGLTGWNWNVDPASLAQFRSGAYGSSFPAGSIVGESAEGYVISFSIVKTKISAIFVSKSVALATAPAP